MKTIAYIYNDYQEKYGIPRQSGLVDEVVSKIVFEKEYRNPEALRGLEDYDYIWLLWKFSKNHDKEWSATVKPPRLGGKKRMGVFATRSPYRPNNIGLSSVKIVDVNLDTPEGPVIYVAGADMINKTPIYDIKPYLAYADSHPNAREGFAGNVKEYDVEVKFQPELMEALPENVQKAVVALLKQDPRPAYDREKNREYKLAFGGYDFVFHAAEKEIVIDKVICLS